MDFETSDKYINKRCGLHTIEGQELNENGDKGHFNNKGTFIKCSCHEHITAEQYDKITSDIIDEFISAGLLKTDIHFEKNNEDNLKKKYEKLKNDCTLAENINSQKTKDSNSIIKFYQKGIYSVKDHKEVSLKDLWNRSNLEKAFKQLNKPKSTTSAYFSSSIIKQIKYVPVTIYSPIMTKSILKELDCKNIFDPCIGWGGRMLGTTCINGTYTGCEPCNETFKGLKSISKLLNLESQINIINKPVEETLNNELKDKYFDCCITSPPYFNLEIYSDEDTQSIESFKSYVLWKDNFIEPIIKYITEHVSKYSCWSVKNFTTDNYYPFAEDVEKIHIKYGWGKYKEYSIIKQNKTGTSMKGDITYIYTKLN